MTTQPSRTSAPSRAQVRAAQIMVERYREGKAAKPSRYVENLARSAGTPSAGQGHAEALVTGVGDGLVTCGGVG